MALKQVGNFVARGAGRVDPALVAILTAAAERTGMNVEAYSGYRPGDRRQHRCREHQRERNDDRREDSMGLHVCRSFQSWVPRSAIERPR